MKRIMVKTEREPVIVVLDDVEYEVKSLKIKHMRQLAELEKAENDLTAITIACDVFRDLLNIPVETFEEMDAPIILNAFHQLQSTLSEQTEEAGKN